MNERASAIEGHPVEVTQPPDVLARQLQDDGTFPNNKLPLLVYRRAVLLGASDPALVFEKMFAAHGWCGSWRNGIYTYHHYHSTSHEVLGVYRGTGTVQLGGPSGVTYDVYPGDVLIIPAGVAHMNLDSSRDFGVVGAYPDSREWDMNYGKPGERPRADEHIARVPLPAADPVYGTAGPLLEHWRALKS